ncbi:hypothetical protein PGT21_016553 [Puccinia graminis f. sp. tritici]|uniref:Uncharacterized protein n=1 Tax=Puccinia graminis f. sp. tritici TaxID=56615 RepID=A0A5B0LNL3_PUCGR|nr:hypothetical protein PGT21_016553 [Puccinia graminis f. sp. tritici]KAA1130511.1 hypothetical protein PGTUg99_013844 [Puccinia graminis f. sp. tritici]
MWQARLHSQANAAHSRLHSPSVAGFPIIPVVGFGRDGDPCDARCKDGQRQIKLRCVNFGPVYTKKLIINAMRIIKPKQGIPKSFPPVIVDDGGEDELDWLPI